MPSLARQQEETVGLTTTGPAQGTPGAGAAAPRTDRREDDRFAGLSSCQFNSSDIGGSIRLPAAWCGVVGLKPSRGRTSTLPITDPNLVEHVITRSVRDTAAFLDAVGGADPTDAYHLSPPAVPYATTVSSDECLFIPGIQPATWPSPPPSSDQRAGETTWHCEESGAPRATPASAVRVPAIRRSPRCRRSGPTGRGRRLRSGSARRRRPCRAGPCGSPA